MFCVRYHSISMARETFWSAVALSQDSRMSISISLSPPLSCILACSVALLSSLFFLHPPIRLTPSRPDSQLETTSSSSVPFVYICVVPSATTALLLLLALSHRCPYRPLCKTYLQPLLLMLATMSNIKFVTLAPVPSLSSLPKLRSNVRSGMFPSRLVECLW
jgi:hypothetical protein